MAQGTLNEILEVEKQIKAMLDNEAAKAQEWLEKAKREIEEARQSAISDLNASVARGREEAKAEADKKGAEMVRRAHALADRIERLDDDSLREFIWEHIVDILPRITRDR